jgi:hypothetical protein
MLITVLVVSLLGGGTPESPLQLCTGDLIKIGRGYDMHAWGNVRCTVDDVMLWGEEADVSVSADRSTLRVVVSGSGRITVSTRGTMRGDRITVEMKQIGLDWSVLSVLVEFPFIQWTPAEPRGK